MTEKFLRSGTMFTNNVNIVCLGTTVEKVFDHSVLPRKPTYVTYISTNTLVLNNVRTVGELVLSRTSCL
jgi:hypothetical protein